MAFNVSSLPTYVEVNKIELKVKAVLAPKTADLVTLQTGLKGKTSINIISSDVTFQDGATCGFNALGDTTVSQRFIDPRHVKVNMEWCDKDMLNKFAQYEVVSAATGKELPFEEYIISEVLDKVGAGVENMIWDGDSNLTLAGLATIAVADGATAVAKGADAYESVLSVYNTLPADVTAHDDFAIFVTPAIFKEFVQTLVAKNMYHYNANDATGEVTIPGTTCKVVVIPNWKGASVNILGGRKSNLFYGLDLESDSTDIDLWFSKDDRTFKLAIEFVIGSGIAYPNEVAYVLK